MIVEYIRYRISPDRHDEFLSSYTEAAKSLDDSEYCLGYELAQCREEKERFILRIQWTSSDDHLQKFRSSADFRNFLPKISPYIDDIEEMKHYELTDVVSVKS